MREGWGKSWGIYLTSPAAMPDLRRHLQRFLTVKDGYGRNYIYRFYDPRVLRAALPTVSPQERARFFGPVGRMVVEDQNPGAVLEFRNPYALLAGPASPGQTSDARRVALVAGV
jgi:hypothetical protein